MILDLLIYLVLFILGAFVSASVTLYIFFQKKFKYWDKKNVPHAQPSFPLGNLSTKESVARRMRNLYDESKHERFYGTWQLYQPTLMVNDLDLIKQILISDFTSFDERGAYYNEKDDPLSAHLFSLDGPSWRKLRVKVTPTFTPGKIKMMFDLVVKCGKEMQEVTENSAAIGDVIEVKDLASRFATDSISSCAFGIEANSFKDPNSTIKKMGSKVLGTDWMNIMRKTLALLAPDLGKLIKMNFNSKEVSDFFLQLFLETMNYREKCDVKRNDLIDLLIQLKTKDSIGDVDWQNEQDQSENVEKLTAEEAAALAFTYFAGGFDTTSMTIQFTLYELAMNQKIQKKVRKEIKNILARHNGELTYEGVMTEMEYLGRVVDETIRKYTPGFVLSRVCVKDYKVPDSHLVIEKGTRIIIPACGIHMDERYFPNPENFDPDRFTEEQKSARQNFTYLPFGDGPRVCIGQRFGLLQTKVGLISLLTKYKFDEAPGRTPNPIEFDPRSFLLSPKGGMHLKISIADEV